MHGAVVERPRVWLEFLKTTENKGLNVIDRCWTSKQGQAGVYQVASQLLLRGLNISIPAVDDGADLIVESGVRIQVKGTRLSNRGTYPGGAYWFHFVRNTRKLQAARLRCVKTDATQRFSERCEVAVLWGIDQNRFWVVPAAALDGRSLIAVGSETVYRKPVNPDVVSDLRGMGKTQQEIADLIGTSRATVSRKESRKNLTITGASLVSSYENRWDVIIDQVKSYCEDLSPVSVESE